MVKRLIKFATALKKYLVCKEDIDVKNLFLTALMITKRKCDLFRGFAQC